MPDTPTKEAMEVARKIGDKNYQTFEEWVNEIAAALDAYAAEHPDPGVAKALVEMTERCAEALTRAEAAEVEAREHKEHCATLLDANNRAVVRYTAAEERVRVLEASIDLALRFMPQHEPHTKILRDSRLAKAAPTEDAR